MSNDPILRQSNVLLPNDPAFREQYRSALMSFFRQEFGARSGLLAISFEDNNMSLVVTDGLADLTTSPSFATPPSYEAALVVQGETALVDVGTHADTDSVTVLWKIGETVLSSTLWDGTSFVGFTWTAAEVGETPHAEVILTRATVLGVKTSVHVLADLAAITAPPSLEDFITAPAAVTWDLGTWNDTNQGKQTLCTLNAAWAALYNNALTELHFYSGNNPLGSTEFVIAGNTATKLTPNVLKTSNGYRPEGSVYNCVVQIRLSDNAKAIVSPVVTTVCARPTVDPPVEPGAGLTPVTTTSQIVLGDITFNLQSQETYGLYLGGNAFIEGAFSVGSYTPAAVVQDGRPTNGAMKGVAVNTNQTKTGFDGAMVGAVADRVTYDAAVNAGLSLPIAVAVGEKISVAKSNLGAAHNGGQLPLKHLRTIHAVSTVPPINSFEPSYIVSATNFDRDWSDVQLDKLTPINGTITGVATPTQAQILAFLEAAHPYYDPHFREGRSILNPTDARDTYGREFRAFTGVAALWCMLSDQTEATIMPVLAWLLNAGRQAGMMAKRRFDTGFNNTWFWDGGHSQGQADLCWFTGHMLDVGDSNPVIEFMKNITTHRTDAGGVGPFRLVTANMVSATNGAGWVPSGTGGNAQPYHASMVDGANAAYSMPDCMIPRNDNQQSADWRTHQYRMLSTGPMWAWEVVRLYLDNGAAKATWNRKTTDFAVRAAHVIRGQADPWRTRLGYPAVGGIAEASSQGIHKNVNLPWAYEMFWARYGAKYTLPWA